LSWEVKMGYFIFGIALIVIGFFLFRYRKRTEYRLTSYTISREATVSELIEEFTEVSGDGLGKGYYKQLIAMHGIVETEQPLISELSNKPCVKYQMHVGRDWEEDYKERNDQGQLVTKTRHKTDTVTSNEQSRPFYINDGTGKIRVSPDGANMTLEKVLDRYKPANHADYHDTISIGNFRFNLTSHLSSHRRLLGYRYEEWIFPIGRRVFIHGEVSDSGGELTFQQPSDAEKNEPFIITLKSKSELIQQTAKKIKTIKYFTYAAFIIGAVLTVLGILYFSQM